MIVFGRYNNIPENFIPVNFTGMNETVQKISTIGLENIDISDPEFDKAFAEIMLNNDMNFISLFNIIQLLYAGENIFICISTGNILDCLNESLGKLIQQRYGYNYQMINEINDIDWYDDENFSIPGLYNFDLDRDRYIHICTNNGILL